MKEGGGRSPISGFLAWGWEEGVGSGAPRVPPAGTENRHRKAKGTPLNVLPDPLGHGDLKMDSPYSHEAPILADDATRTLDQESRYRDSGGGTVVPLIQ
jgi:hypothetical protein